MADIAMMGVSHAASGWCAGLALAPVFGLTALVEVLLFAAATAGFSLLADLDCEGARASRLLGPVTGGVSWALRRTSATVYRLTKGPRDANSAGTHRHLSHTVIFAFALGGVTAGGIALGGPWVAVGVLLFGVLLASDALGNWVLLVAVLSAAGLFITAPGAALNAMLAILDAVGGWLGIAVTVGCLVHLVGDALTYAGLPIWWPILYKGQRWYETGVWRPLRFGAGSDFEKRFMFPAFVVLGVLLVPRVWTLAATVTTNLYTAIHQAAS
jgi:hypothetical protein